MTENSPNIPIVACALGQSPDELLEASSFPFEFSEIYAIDLVGAIRPMRFQYLGKSTRFELPLVGTISISFNNAIITGLRICPHLPGLFADGACRVVLDVSEILSTAGFRVDVSLGEGVTGLPAALRDRTQPTDTTFLIGKWTRGDDTVWLEVERTGLTALDQRNPSTTHLVRLRIENGPLTSRTLAQVKGGGRYVVWKKAGPT